MAANKRTRLCIVYPTDPVGEIVGGIDTYISGVIRSAPADFDVSVVGVTTDPALRPVGHWTSIEQSDREINLYPTLFLKNPERQGRIPLSLRFTLSLRSMTEIEADILEFHRIEPTIAFLRDPRPKALIVHQNMNVLRDSHADIRWRHAPDLFFRLEKYLLPRMSSVVCVREDAARQYNEKYPELADRIRFAPTWMDPEIFFPPAPNERHRYRQEIREEYGFDLDDFVVITVGRLDNQKNPLLLLESFRQVKERVSNARLLFIGDGLLAPKIRQFIARYGLQRSVTITGVKTRAQVAEYLRGADLFVLSSAYEGMPMSLLEALGSGLPVVSTSVGEVARVIHPGINGELVEVHEPDALAGSMLKCLTSWKAYTPENCVTSVSDYTPSQVLAKTFDVYRRLGQQSFT